MYEKFDIEVYLNKAIYKLVFAIAANKEGLFINKEFFKKVFILWLDFSEIKTNSTSGYLELVLKDFGKIVNQHKGIGKGFLKRTYFKDQSPISIAPVDSEDDKRLIEYIKSNNGM